MKRLRALSTLALIGACVLICSAVLIRAAVAYAEPSTKSPSIRAHLISDDFEHPVQIVSDGNHPAYLYIVERAGIVRALKNGELVADELLDLEGTVSTKHAHGLMSVTFPPSESEPKNFYASFIDVQGDIIVAQFPVRQGNPADDDSMTILMKLAQAFSNTNSTHIEFGPDTYLYISSGDGGGPPENFQAAQRLSSLFGKILRVKPEPRGGYSTPSDNPYTTEPHALPENWALGFRNPRHFSFDRKTGGLFVLDEGVRQVEVNRVERGKNYGWNEMEGSTCLHSTCLPPAFQAPIATLTSAQSPNDIVGGFVYRGARFPELQGTYIYAISSLGELRLLRESAEGWKDAPLIRLPNKLITAIGSDSNGEPLCATDNGELFELIQ